MTSTHEEEMEELLEAIKNRYVDVKRHEEREVNSCE